MEEINSLVKDYKAAQKESSRLSRLLSEEKYGRGKEFKTESDIEDAMKDQETMKIGLYNDIHERIGELDEKIKNKKRNKKQINKILEILDPEENNNNEEHREYFSGGTRRTHKQKKAKKAKKTRRNRR